MCGPTSTQTKLEGSEQQFMQELMSNYGQNFSEQQQVLNHLNSVLAPILEAGPNQTGFSPSERAAFNTQAINTTGAGAANAERAIANETAGRNDSGNLSEAGNVAALKANAASAAEGQLSAEELGITEADYATGRANFNAATAAEEGVAGQFGSGASSAMGGANAANTAAFGEATQIAQEQAQEEADIAGGVTSLASGGVSGFAKLFQNSGGGGGAEDLSNVDLSGFADLAAF
jgi:hypothetical protein